MDSVIKQLQAEWNEIEDDLRACHEYYCRYNCSGLVGVNHTPRCTKLREKYGFLAYPSVGRAVPDVKA